MKHRLKKSTAVALGAAAAAIGLASPASALNIKTITYVLSINDDGFGDYTPNAFAIFAVDGTVQSTGSGSNMVATGFTTGSDGGILGYGVSVSNTTSLNDDIQYGNLDPAYSGLGQLAWDDYYTIAINSTTGNKKPVQAGFTSNASDQVNSVQAGQLAINAPPPSASGITTGSTMMIPIFGLGQTGGNMQGDLINSVPAPSGYVIGGKAGGSQVPATPFDDYFSGPLLTDNPSFPAGQYLSSLLIADGAYSGPLPSLSATGPVLAQNILFTAPNETFEGGYASTLPTLAYFTETLTVPEPAAPAFLAAGAVGLLALRRRRATWQRQ